jgi:hypothetical protein
MSSLRKLALVTIVWLTSAMTVVAGVPRFVCHCPDGPGSKECAGAISPSCCERGCCRAATASGRSPGTAQSSCCHQAKTKETPTSPPERKGCTKTIAQVQEMAPSPAKTLVTLDLSTAWMLPATIKAGWSVTERFSQVTSFEIPSPDFTTVLQRLLI